MARILVVDDERQVRSVLRQVLERSGHEVQEAPEGKSAVELYREGPSDLVITDIVMPGKDGIETIMEIKRVDPNVKIIAISGGGHVGPESYLLVAQRLGAKRVFAKPVAPAELLEAVSQVLSE